MQALGPDLLFSRHCCKAAIAAKPPLLPSRHCCQAAIAAKPPLLSRRAIAFTPPPLMTSRYCCQAATIAAIANNHILRFSTVGALSAPLALQSARPSAVATRTEQLASAPGKSANPPSRSPPLSRLLHLRRRPVIALARALSCSPFSPTCSSPPPFIFVRHAARACPSLCSSPFDFVWHAAQACLSSSSPVGAQASPAYLHARLVHAWLVLERLIFKRLKLVWHVACCFSLCSPSRRPRACRCLPASSAWLSCEHVRCRMPLAQVNPQPADPGRLAHGPRPCASLPSASRPSLTPTS
ncbi:hypothetical protein T492DRAFT_507289 [Pavlovales sp. CCMP2436]|nr:hypothetical protein T492DRAFT_507289 [Pavlovales sp. CCMP2436]